MDALFLINLTTIVQEEMKESGPEGLHTALGELKDRLAGAIPLHLEDGLQAFEEGCVRLEALRADRHMSELGKEMRAFARSAARLR